MQIPLESLGAEEENPPPQILFVRLLLAMLTMRNLLDQNIVDETLCSNTTFVVYKFNNSHLVIEFIGSRLEKKHGSARYDP